MTISSVGLGPELPYLEAFRTVCAEGGFTAAAAKLGCTQPAVSYQIRRLEEVLGVTLLERDGRRIVLSEAGKRFRTFADKVFVELARVRGECLAGQRLEPLRLGSASGFGRYVLLPALHVLREEQEKRGEGAGALEVRLEYEAADVILDRLEAGAYEAAFVYKRRVSNTLSYEAVCDEELVLVGGPRLSEKARSLGLDRLETFEQLPFVTYEESDYVFGRWFDSTFGEQPARQTSAAHFTELEEVIDFVAHGVGLSLVPRDSVEAAHARGAIEILYAGSGEPCHNQVFMVSRVGSDIRSALRRLAELIGTRQARD